MPVTGLRIVTFNVLPPAYLMIARWAEQTGNKLVLVVTTPGPPTRRMPMYTGVVAGAPPEQDILVTTRLRKVGRAQHRYFKAMSRNGTVSKRPSGLRGRHRRRRTVFIRPI